MSEVKQASEENEATRDHTEKMLESFGANIKVKERFCKCNFS